MPIVSIALAFGQCKAALVDALRGKTAYQMAEVILDILADLKIGVSLLSERYDRREMQSARMGFIPFSSNELRDWTPKPPDSPPRAAEPDSPSPAPKKRGRPKKGGGNKTKPTGAS